MFDKQKKCSMEKIYFLIKIFFLHWAWENRRKFNFYLTIWMCFFRLGFTRKLRHCRKLWVFSPSPKSPFFYYLSIRHSRPLALSKKKSPKKKVTQLLGKFLHFPFVLWGKNLNGEVRKPAEIRMFFPLFGIHWGNRNHRLTKIFSKMSEFEIANLPF